MHTKEELIALGRILETMDVFEKRIHLNFIPDAKNSERIYAQVRSSCCFKKGKRKWYAKYVGPKGRYTPERLRKAKIAIKKAYMDDLSEQLSVYNYKIEDFT
jgi:hypothetical protein